MLDETPTARIAATPELTDETLHPVKQRLEGAAPKTATQRSREFRLRRKEALARHPPTAEPEKTEPADNKSVDDLPYSARPPRRMPLRTKNKWQTLPDWAREDIWEREQQFDLALKRYEGLGYYQRLAESNGSTLVAAVEKLVAFEKLCVEDPLAAIDAAAQAYGWNPQALGYAYAARHGVMPAQQPDPAAVAVTATIEAFRSDPRNEFLSVVEPAMKVLLESGQCSTLPEAYRTACDLNPHVQELLMARQRPVVNPYTPPRQQAVDRSRAAAKAIGGAPSNGSNKPRQMESHGTAYDDVKAAVERARG